MDPVDFSNNRRYKHLPVTDYVRFFKGAWPLPDSTLDDEDKYFIQRYTTLTPKHIDMFNRLLSMGIDSWSYQNLVESLKIALPEHTDMLKKNPDLSFLAASHSDATLKIATPEGKQFSKLLSSIVIPTSLVVFRTINREYNPPLKIGQRMYTDNIWSTSYDPLASLGFGLSDPNINFVWIMRVVIPKGFKGGSLLENNCSTTIKEQHEFTMAGGLCFDVRNILENVKLEAFDDVLGTRTINAKIYDLIPC